MGIYLIAARSKNGVIGVDGKIPWKIKGEQSQFKELTIGNAVIMGRNTYEEIGKPLPDRLNIIVSGKKTFEGENLITVSSLDEGIKKAREMGYKDIYIAGGAMLYAEAISIVDKMYITEIDILTVPLKRDAQITFFPNFSSGDFKYSEGEWQGNEGEWQGNDCRYRRTVYVRKPKEGSIFHKYIKVDSDEMNAAGFDSVLADFAAKKLSEWKMSETEDAKIISIESKCWVDEIRTDATEPVLHSKRTMQLSVWLEQQ